MTPLWLAPLVCLLAAGGCGLYLRLARRWRLLDHPGARSSHRSPTPHGGGVPLLLALACGVVLAPLAGISWPGLLVWLLALALGLMSLGLLDDVLNLSVRLRFLVYASCCLVAVQAIAGEVVPVWSMVPLALALLWGLNLYNFMDGTDGLAASQCILACVVAALLAWVVAGEPEYALFCLLLAAAHLGFLVWNFPPARLFMGDAGSVPTGFLLGGLALLGEVQAVVPAASWLILLAVFITDATWTLTRRLLAGENITRPHRNHLYQRLSRHWGSHLAVMMALVAVVSLWLFPLAWAAQTFEQLQLFLVILAYLPLCICMAKTADIA